MNPPQEIEEFEELPYLVVDLEYLYDRATPKAHLIRGLYFLFDEFNIYIWINNSGLWRRNLGKYQKLIDLYEFDIATKKQCTDKEIQSFIQIHSTIILSNSDKLAQQIGWRVVSSEDFKYIKTNYDYLSRRIMR